MTGSRAGWHAYNIYAVLKLICFTEYRISPENCPRRGEAVRDLAPEAEIDLLPDWSSDSRIWDGPLISYHCRSIDWLTPKYFVRDLVLEI